MKILFQGDSITDADRDREDPHNLGNGYPKDAARFLKEKFPELDFEFIDLGISGNQTIDLVNRLQSDFIDSYRRQRHMAQSRYERVARQRRV